MLPEPDNAPPGLYALLVRCWQILPEQRPDFQTILMELRALRETTAAATPPTTVTVAQGIYYNNSHRGTPASSSSSSNDERTPFMQPSTPTETMTSTNDSSSGSNSNSSNSNSNNNNRNDGNYRTSSYVEIVIGEDEYSDSLQLSPYYSSGSTCTTPSPFARGGMAPSPSAYACTQSAPHVPDNSCCEAK